MTDFITPEQRLEAFAPSRQLDICENCNERTSPFATVVIILISFVLGIFSHAVLRACGEPAKAMHVDCNRCHKAELPKIADLKQYKRYHQEPSPADKRLAAELAESERLVFLMTGGQL